MSDAINFAEVPTATTSEYLEPGMYRLKVDKDGSKLFEPLNKTPYIAVRFTSEKGASLTEKFFLTAKALPRLQYLHEAWFNKKLDKTFKSFKEVGEYFLKYLTMKIVTRPMVVGGKWATNGKFYSGLPYTGFVIADESLFEEGAFEKDSDQYKKVVTYDKPNPAVANNDAAVLPNTDELPEAGGYTPAVDNDGMPWGD